MAFLKKTKKNVGNLERVISGIAGIVLVNSITRRDLESSVKLGIASGLIYRSLFGTCGLYSLVGIDHSGTHSGTDVHQKIFIAKSPLEAYQAWRDVKNFPKFMNHLESVQELDSITTQWTVKAFGSKLSWMGKITADLPAHYIAWKSLPGADVENLGSIQFHPIGSSGTEAHLHIRYNPPGGRLTAAIAELTGRGAKYEVDGTLKRFKNFVENNVIEFQSPIQKVANV